MRLLIEDGGRISSGVDKRFDHARAAESERPIERRGEFIGAFRRAAGNAEIMRRRFGRRAEIDSGKRIVPPFLFHLHETETTVRSGCTSFAAYAAGMP